MCSHSLFGALLNTSPPIITNLECGVSWRRSNEQGHSQIQFFSHVRPVHEGRSLNLKPMKYSEMLWSGKECPPLSVEFHEIGQTTENVRVEIGRPRHPPGDGILSPGDISLWWEEESLCTGVIHSFD